MVKKAKFGSRIGLIAATVGSAVGLGNVWRFPAEAQANGGAAFLIVYILCVLLLGIPVMLAEFSLGRGTNSDAVGAFMKLSPGKKWWGTGALAILASYLILSCRSIWLWRDGHSNISGSRSPAIFMPLWQARKRLLTRWLRLFMPVWVSISPAVGNLLS